MWWRARGRGLGKKDPRNTIALLKCAYTPEGSSLAPYYEGILNNYPQLQIAPFQAPASLENLQKVFLDEDLQRHHVPTRLDQYLERSHAADVAFSVVPALLVVAPVRRRFDVWKSMNNKTMKHTAKYNKTK